MIHDLKKKKKKKFLSEVLPHFNKMQITRMKRVAGYQIESLISRGKKKKKIEMI